MKLNMLPLNNIHIYCCLLRTVSFVHGPLWVKHQQPGTLRPVECRALRSDREADLFFFRSQLKCSRDNVSEEHRWETEIRENVQRLT